MSIYSWIKSCLRKSSFTIAQMLLANQIASSFIIDISRRNRWIIILILNLLETNLWYFCDLVYLYYLLLVSNFTKSNTPLWYFPRFLNCTSSTKSCKASHLLLVIVGQHFVKTLFLLFFKLSGKLWSRNMQFISCSSSRKALPNFIRPSERNLQHSWANWYVIANRTEVMV